MKAADMFDALVAKVGESAVENAEAENEIVELVAAGERYRAEVFALKAERDKLVADLLTTTEILTGEYVRGYAAGQAGVTVAVIFG